MDIFEKARQNICPSLIQAMFPGGRIELDEYWALSPLRNDKQIGSFHINLTSGQWVDHATDDGGDFIDLVHKAQNITKKEAAEIIAGEQVEKSTHVKNKPKILNKLVPAKQDEETKQRLMDAVTNDFYKEKFGEAVKIWQYINSDNRWIFSTIKFVKENGSKDVIPFYLSDKHKWKSSGSSAVIGTPEPYGINRVKPNDKILIVEGEKCADCIVDGYTLISWWGGTSRAKKTNWDAIKDFEDITIWPDYDHQLDKSGKLYPANKQPGLKAANDIKSILSNAKILNIYKNGIKTETKNGWDIADLLDNGGDPLDFIKNHPPLEDFDGGPLVPGGVTPKNVKEYFIDNFYKGGLKQFNGNYWEYLSGKRYWRQTSKVDISCNLQMWLDDTGIQDNIEFVAYGKVTKFITDTESYIRRHRRTFEDNPFLESATNPFINMKNGVIEIIYDKFKWHPLDKKEPDFFKNLHLISSLDFDFKEKETLKTNPEIDCPVFYKFIKGLVPLEYLVNNDMNEAYKECLSFICQIIAYSISPIKDRPLFFGIYGDEETGKSFLVRIIKEFIGEKFSVERPVGEWSNRFFSHSLWGKKILIEPDMEADAKLPDNIIKLYNGDVSLTVEGKNKSSEDGVKMSLAIFLVSNYKFKAKALEGINRRIVMVPFKNKLAKEDVDNFMLKRMLGQFPNYDNVVKDERPAIMNLVLEAWAQLCRNKFHITSPEWSQKEKEQWLLDENTIKKFISVKFTNTTEKIIQSKKVFYIDYTNWCQEEGNDFPYKKKRFFEEVLRNRRFNIKRNSQGLFIHIEPDNTNSKNPDDDDVPF